jgi:tetratricopeptide (TPR) repeat protein
LKVLQPIFLFSICIVHGLTLCLCPVEASPAKGSPVKVEAEKISPAVKAFGLLNQAKQCYEAQKYREVVTLTTAVIDSHNYLPMAYWMRANSLLRLEKPAEALQDLAACEKVGFVVGSAFYEERARCHVETGNWKQALTDLDRAVAIRPVVSTYRMQGEICFQHKLDDRAVQCFKKALAIDPSDYWSNRDLASLYDSRKEYDKALVHCNLMIRMRPGEPDGYGLRAKIYQHMGKPDLAKKDLEQTNSKSDFPF